MDWVRFMYMCCGRRSLCRIILIPFCSSRRLTTSNINRALRSLAYREIFTDITYKHALHLKLFFSQISQGLKQCLKTVCALVPGITVPQLTPAVFTPRTSVLPRHISLPFPLPKFLRLYLQFPAHFWCV